MFFSRILIDYTIFLRFQQIIIKKIDISIILSIMFTQIIKKQPKKGL